MVEKTEPSYADLVYEVLKAARQPLTFNEIFEEVNRHRPVATRNPKGTIRNALGQGAQLVSLGDGRYGYLPYLVQGSLLRQPLIEKKPADHPLVFPDELRQALWPSFFESRKRKNRRPAHLRLPNGDEAELPLEFFGSGVWGASMPAGLARYLVENHAAEGDSLLVRVVDGEAGRCEGRFEARGRRDNSVVARRNRELADGIYRLLRENRGGQMIVWELAIALLARGSYRSDVAPDPLQGILKADPRFVDAGMQMWILAETVTPEREDRIRKMKRLETDILHPGRKAQESVPEATPPLSTRYAMERTMADVGALLEKKQFGSIEEANSFLQGLMGKGGPPRREPKTPAAKAQELMYDAWESPDRRERVKLARKALEISPDCADAYVLLAEETARSAREAADLYAKGMAAGERALGKKTFREAVGAFWGVVETRPYMRARLGLAQALWAMGRQREAMDHLWEMLKLNPGDNQGVRYLLLSWLLEMREDVQVGKLLDLYPDDALAAWAYGRALHAFRLAGDSKAARKALAEARKQNPYVPPYLLGRRRVPRQLPEAIGLGGEGEAVSCAAEQMAAWRETPGALDWLAQQAG